MFLLSRRQVHAALAGAAAACAYYATAELGSKRPVRFGGLFLLSSAALAGVIAQGASIKAYSTAARVDNFFANGGQVGGDFTVHGNHTVNGNHTVTGASNLAQATMGGDILFNGHNISNVSEINTDGNAVGVHGDFFTNGHSIFLGGGNGHAQGGSWT